MGRTLFSILSAVSLLLCVASCALWYEARQHLALLWLTQSPIVIVGCNAGDCYFWMTQVPPEYGPQRPGLYRWQKNIPTGRGFAGDVVISVTKRHARALPGVRDRLHEGFRLDSIAN